MIGQKTAQPKLYFSFSLDQAVPRNHFVRRLAAAVDFSFVYGLVRRRTCHRRLRALVAFGYRGSRGSSER